MTVTSDLVRPLRLRRAAPAGSATPGAGNREA